MYRSSSPTVLLSIRFLLFTGLFILLTVGCAGNGQHTVWDGPPKTEAETAYRAALENMEAGRYIEATKEFNHVRLKFPYSSRWTTLSELRLADISYEQSSYARASEMFLQFIKAHPTHAEVPYAYFSAGECYYEEIPSDIFLLPDPEQRDLSSVLQAELAYKRFLARFPESDKAPKAKERLAEMRERLAMHEIYAAEFYFKKKHYLGASNRLLYMIERYPTTPLSPRGFFLLGNAYNHLKDVKSAAGALQRLLSDYPDDPLAQDAREWLIKAEMSDIAPMAIGGDLARIRRAQARKGSHR